MINIKIAAYLISAAMLLYGCEKNNELETKSENKSIISSQAETNATPDSENSIVTYTTEPETISLTEAEAESPPK